eukprot:scaffold7328_cov314-Pinguiococcus_pyrenoidosus.AAC.87
MRRVVIRERHCRAIRLRRRAEAIEERLGRLVAIRRARILGHFQKPLERVRGFPGEQKLLCGVLVALQDLSQGRVGDAQSANERRVHPRELRVGISQRNPGRAPRGPFLQHLQRGLLYRPHRRRIQEDVLQKRKNLVLRGEDDLVQRVALLVAEVAQGHRAGEHGRHLEAEHQGTEDIRTLASGRRRRRRAGQELLDQGREVDAVIAGRARAESCQEQAEPLPHGAVRGGFSHGHRVEEAEKRRAKLLPRRRGQGIPVARHLATNPQVIA